MINCSWAFFFFFVLFFKRPFRETTSALMRKAGKPPDRIVSVVSTSTLILIQFIFFFFNCDLSRSAKWSTSSQLLLMCPQWHSLNVFLCTSQFKTPTQTLTLLYHALVRRPHHRRQLPHLRLLFDRNLLANHPPRSPVVIDLTNQSYWSWFLSRGSCDLGASASSPPCRRCRLRSLISFPTRSGSNRFQLH
jgi:hypothetical protein